jgi:hypothetical protein
MNNYQNIEIAVSTITFMFLFGYIRPMILGEHIDSINVVITTLMFFLWYYITSKFTGRSI